MDCADPPILTMIHSTKSATLVQKYEQEILPRTKESLQLTQQLYEKGDADFLDLLAIQRTLQEVNLNYIDSQEARASAAADLGGLLQMEQFP